MGDIPPTFMGGPSIFPGVKVCGVWHGNFSAGAMFLEPVMQ